MIRQVRTGWQLLSSRDRSRWLSTVPLAASSAVLEAVGAAAVYGLIRLIGDPTQIARVPILARAAAWLPWKDPHVVVLAATVVVAVLYLVKNVTMSVLAWTVSKASAESWSSLSQRLLRGYLRAPFVFHLQRNSAELVHSTIEAADVVFRLVIGPAVAMAAELLVVAGVVIVLLLTAPGVTIVAVVLLFALLALLVRTTRQALTRWGKQEHMMREQTLKTLHQTLEGYKEVKLRGREEFFQHRFGEQHDAMNSVRHRFMTLSSVSRLFVETVFIIGLLGVVVLVTLTSDGKVELIPVLGVYAYAGFRIIPSVNRILLHISNIRYGLPAVDLVSRDLKACEAAPELASGLSNGEHVLAFRQRLDIEDVSFSYPNSTAAVLRRLNLSFACGESVGIVGPTGAGKSTLVNIVLGLLTPSAGRILVDGVDIQSVLPNWQRKIGYVPQSVYLIDDSLRRNIAFAVAEDEIDDSRIQRALKRAQLEAFVAGLPRGLDTVIGERGVRLSGGERQRVAIARALYYEPELLVFDEATSSLDMRTERDLTSAIESLHGQKTMLIVAHRLSTVRNCDRLVFLRNNDDVAVGSYEDLMSNCTDFRTMAAGGSASEQTGTPAA